MGHRIKRERLGIQAVWDRARPIRLEPSRAGKDQIRASMALQADNGTGQGAGNPLYVLDLSHDEPGEHVEA